MNRNRMKGLYIFAALFFVASAAVHILLSENPHVTLYSDIIAVVVAGLPLITVMYAFLYFERGTPRRRILLFLLVGLVLWLLGETGWLYYEGLMHVDPFPSVADLFWIHGYIAVLAALILQYRLGGVRLEKIYEIAIGLAVVAAGVVMLSILLYFITGEEEFTLLEKTITLYYPVADLLLLYIALLMTGLYWKGRLSHAWLLLALGIVAYSVGDLWYAYLEWTDVYWEMLWHPVDFTWIIGDLLVFLGAAKYRISFEELV